MSANVAPVVEGRQGRPPRRADGPPGPSSWRGAPDVMPARPVRLHPCRGAIGLARGVVAVFEGTSGNSGNGRNGERRHRPPGDGGPPRWPARIVVGPLPSRVHGVPSRACSRAAVGMTCWSRCGGWRSSSRRPRCWILRASRSANATLARLLRERAAERRRLSVSGSGPNSCARASSPNDEATAGGSRPISVACERRRPWSAVASAACRPLNPLAEHSRAWLARRRGAHPAVRRIVAARVAGPATAEDLVQETLVRVLGAAARVEPGMLEPYAIVTARNVVASMWSERDRHRRNQHRVARPAAAAGARRGRAR